MLRLIAPQVDPRTVVLHMSAGQRSLSPVLVVGVVILVLLGAVWGVSAIQDDRAASGNESSDPTAKPKPKPQDTTRISWGAIDSLGEEDAADPDWPEGRIGVPAVAYDPVVGTVALWPNGRDVEVRIKPPGEPWGAQRTFSGGENAEFVEAPLVATDGAGTVTAAWVRTLAFGVNGPWQSDLVTATRAPDGDWAEPTVLWEAPWLENLESTPMGEPHLAVGANGSAAMAWTEDSLTDPSDEDSGFTQAHAVYRPAGREWQQEVMLGRGRHDPRGFGNYADEVGIDSRGLATVVVSDDGGMRAFRNEGRTWKPMELIAPGGGASDVEVAPDGTISMVLTDHHDNWNEVRATTMDDGSWTPSVRLAPRKPPKSKQDYIYFNNPQLAVHSGIETLVYTSWSGPVQAVTRSPGGEYGAPETIAVADRDDLSLDILGVWANEKGQALAIWGPSGEGDGWWVPRGAYRESADGPWRAPVPLSDGKSITGDVLTQYAGVAAVVYPSGAALVLWSDGHRILSRTLGQIE